MISVTVSLVATKLKGKSDLSTNQSGSKALSLFSSDSLEISHSPKAKFMGGTKGNDVGRIPGVGGDKGGKKPGGVAKGGRIMLIIQGLRYYGNLSPHIGELALWLSQGDTTTD